MNVPLPQPGSRTQRPDEPALLSTSQTTATSAGSATPRGVSFAGDANVVDASGGGVVSGHDLWRAAWTNPARAPTAGAIGFTSHTQPGGNTDPVRPAPGQPPQTLTDGSAARIGRGLGGPQVGSEDFVADSGRRHA